MALKDFYVENLMQKRKFEKKDKEYARLNSILRTKMALAEIASKKESELDASKLLEVEKHLKYNSKLKGGYIDALMYLFAACLIIVLLNQY